MNELARQLQSGYFSFRTPEETELLNTPWGYYRFLDVPTDATPDEIKKTYRKLAIKLHPDAKGGDENAFKTLKNVAETLLDDGGVLGREYSKRMHYDEFCSLDFNFGGFIECDGQKTRKISEIMLTQFENERKLAEELYKRSEVFREYTEMENKLKTDIDSEKEKIIKNINDRAKELRITPEMLEKAKKIMKEKQEQFEASQRPFFNSLKNSTRYNLNKTLDIFYVGQGKVIFDDNGHTEIGVVAHKERGSIFELVLTNDAQISGFSKIHFKAPKADVVISDPNVEGLIHVINGNIKLTYRTTAYRSVIRARAPRVDINGFEQRGDLYISKTYASDGWWKKKPALDIAIRDGAISLSLVNPFLFEAVTPVYPDYSLYKNSIDDLLGGKSWIEDMLGGSVKKDKKSPFDYYGLFK